MIFKGFDFFYRGMCMYRTHALYDLILKGVPEKYRGEVWVVFSGATHEVSLPSKIMSNLKNLSSISKLVILDDFLRVW